jgi:translocation and assembly module TamB
MELTFAAKLPDVAPIVSALEGPADLRGTLREGDKGIEIDTTLTGPLDANAVVQGALTPAVDVGFDLDLPSLEPIAGLDEPFAAKGRLRQSDAGFEIESTVNGPYQSSGTVVGQVVPAVEVAFDLGLPNLNRVVPQVNGPLNLQGKLRQTDLGFFVDTAATGPAGARAVVEGLATGPDMSLTFDASAPNVAPFAPGVSGPFAAKGNIAQKPEGIEITTNATGPYATRAKVSGIATGPDAALAFDVAMANVGALVDQISGPLNVTGTARKQGNAWRLDTNAQGPSGTQAQVAGLAQTDGTVNLDINGTAPLGLAEPFLKPRSLSGLARFDLALNGAPALSSLTGNITANGARFAAPNLRLALQDINMNVALADSRAALDITGAATGGGRVQVTGPIALTGDLPADIAITLQGLVLSDPKLYRTSVDGALRLSGPLSGGATVSGRIDVGETNVSVPSTGITSIGEIPLITHIGDSASARTTRNRAGLALASSAAPPSKGSSSSSGFGLDLTVNAPNRIFVRGRGLDAELGGALNLGGTTGRVISSGQFDLIRGRLDILGKRFDLVEGSAAFEGDLVPYIRFVSSTTTSAGDISVVVEGPADAPEVTFQSNPEAPQDEVLAQLLFGRDITEISAFQALQLASAVATLAGRGGTGVVARLREGFGLDDLDVTTTDDGATAVRAGKYISDNVYTDVTAASDGTGEVSLNLDITPNLTAKGRLGSDGDTGIGLFFQKDY